MASESPLPPITRLITTHNAEGKAIFSDAFPEQAQNKAVDGKAGFTLS